MIFSNAIDVNLLTRKGGVADMRLRRNVILLVLISITPYCARSTNGQEVSVSQTGRSGAEVIPEPSRLVGVGSCTASGCHGGGRANQVVGSEYNIWVTQDPHARAFSTLFEDRSERMIRLLDGLPPGTATTAHKDARCLTCHSMAGTEPKETRGDVISDGVSCEACHGPAQKWLPVHFERRLSSAERDQLGLWNTDSLVTRTQVCVRCHVGSPGREVSHDLIAAGHPRLQFEMSAYLEAMPKHWSESSDRKQLGADFDTKLWAIGQACASQGALEQLAHRADQSKTWPEFAEWSCAACHHNLRDEAPRQQQLATEGGLSGQLIAWDTWNHRTVRRHAADISRAFGLPGDQGARVESNLATLEKQMRQLSPKRRQVAELARGTAGELGRWAAEIEKQHIREPNVDQLSRTILQAQSGANATDWSIAVQTYDALASLHETRLRQSVERLQRPASDPFTLAMKQLYNRLAEHVDSPRNYSKSREAVQTQLGELSKLIPAPASEDKP